MDHSFEQRFQATQELDSFFQDGQFEDTPVCIGLFDEFEAYQPMTPGCLPSPKPSNPGSGRQSPSVPFLSKFERGYVSHPSDESSDADNDPLGSHYLQQVQTSRTGIPSNTSNSHISTDQSFSNTSNIFSQEEVLRGEPSNSCSGLTAPSESSSYVSNDSFQNCAATVSSKDFTEQTAPIGMSVSTHMPLTPPQGVNNTSPASVPASQQHSPTSTPQHYTRRSSHLHHQIHPELPQHSPFALTAPDSYTFGQVPHTMPSTQDFVNHQAPTVLPSYSDFQNGQHSPHRPPFRRITSAHNQGRDSPVSQNYRPFQESSLRTSMTSNSGQNSWGQFQNTQYPEPQPMLHHQSNRSPYVGHHHILGSQENPINSYSQEQHRKPNGSRDVSYMIQEPNDMGFNVSGPSSAKREMSSPGSDSKGQMASPKLQKKRRVKQESKNYDDNEVAVDPVALQTADLTNLDPTDHTNVAALIGAMHNMDNVEDNLGMQKTWAKVRKAKALRIREVCMELLNLTKQAQQHKGTPLGEKRPINHYASFQNRFDALCETLMFQKTVCKHLIEPSYSCSVVDDPVYAKDRVKNNRRVNHQKAEAIRLGREHLGEKGQGKGKPMLKVKKRTQAQIDDNQEDEENSGDEPLSDGETSAFGLSSRPSSAGPSSHTHKRTKRVSRSKCQPDSGVMTNTFVSQSTISNQHQQYRGSNQASHMPHAQHSERPFAQGLPHNGYVPTQQAQMHPQHHQMHHQLAASQQLPTMDEHHDVHSRNGFGNLGYGDHYTGGSNSQTLGGNAYGYK